MGGVAVVEHREDEQLEADGGATAVAGHQRQAGGEAAARARPADRDAGRVDAEVGGVLRQPRQRGVAVTHGRREGMLGSEPVVDRTR